MAKATFEQTVSAILKLAKEHQSLKLPTAAQLRTELALQTLNLDFPTYGEAKKAAEKALAVEKAAATARTLDSPLIDLFVKNSSELTMYRYHKKLMELIRKTAGFKKPQERMIQKLVTVLAQCEHQGLIEKSAANAITVRKFLDSCDVGQMKMVNALWGECTESGTYNVKGSAMVEADNEVELGGSKQLPSSVHPDRSKGGDLKIFVRGRSGKPFCELGVGFRVEGSYDKTKGEGPDKLESTVARVLERGMVPQVTLDWLMMQNGKDVFGTVVANDTSAPRLNKGQKDLWNESGVCVARSFFGATAFPLRGHQGGAILWAVDVKDLTGYDTEDWQVRQGGQAKWRPGEKCFAKVPKDNILGYVVIEKLGDGGSGWKFGVPKGAKWKGDGSPTLQQANYMREELAAWAGRTAAVDTQFDFQN